MLDMHVQRNCYAQLQTGPKPSKSEVPAFSVVWFLNFCMLRDMLRCRNCCPRSPSQRQYNSQGQVMQLVHDSELSSTPGTSLQRWTLNHLASASYTEPRAAQNGMVSNLQSATECGKKQDFVCRRNPTQFFGKLFRCSECFWLRWKANNSRESVDVSCRWRLMPIPTTEGSAWELFSLAKTSEKIWATEVHQMLIHYSRLIDVVYNF